MVSPAVQIEPTLQSEMGPASPKSPKPMNALNKSKESMSEYSLN